MKQQDIIGREVKTKNIKTTQNKRQFCFWDCCKMLSLCLFLISCDSGTKNAVKKQLIQTEHNLSDTEKYVALSRSEGN